MYIFPYSNIYFLREDNKIFVYCLHILLRNVGTLDIFVRQKCLELIRKLVSDFKNVNIP